MNELIAAYEEKIASLEATISIQDQMINSLADFLNDTAGKLYPIIADSAKNSAALSVKIQKLKDQSIDISENYLTFTMTAFEEMKVKCKDTQIIR